jgi:hypothetical protein
LAWKRPNDLAVEQKTRLPTLQSAIGSSLKGDGGRRLGCSAFVDKYGRSDSPLKDLVSL